MFEQRANASFVISATPSLPGYRKLSPIQKIRAVYEVQFDRSGDVGIAIPSFTHPGAPIQVLNLIDGTKTVDIGTLSADDVEGIHAMARWRHQGHLRLEQFNGKWVLSKNDPARPLFIFGEMIQMFGMEFALIYPCGKDAAELLRKPTGPLVKKFQPDHMKKAWLWMNRSRAMWTPLDD